MKKVFLAFLLLTGYLSQAQRVEIIRADSIKLEPLGGKAAVELMLRNATRHRTGAYLQNIGNGRTAWNYTLDSVHVQGDTALVFRRGGTLPPFVFHLGGVLGGPGGGSNVYQYSIVNTDGTVTLLGDVAEPGATQYYGTNDAGARGFYPLPTEQDPTIPQHVRDITLQNIVDWNGKQDALPTGLTVNQYLGWTGSGFAWRQIDYSEIANTPNSQFAVQAGANITVTGNGTTQDPYVISTFKDTASGGAAGAPSSLVYIVGTTAGAPAAGTSTFLLPEGAEAWEVALYRGKLRESTIPDASGVYYSKPFGSRTLTIHNDTWHTGESVVIEFYRSTGAVAPLPGGGGGGGVVATSFDVGTGILSITNADASSVTTDLDGRYLQSFTEVDGSTTNELQTLSYDAATRLVTLSGGGSFTIPAEVDGSITNEIQTLSLNSTTRTISLSNGGGSVVLPAEVDGSTTNELQVLSYNTGTRQVTLSNGGGSFTIPAEVDGSITNELQSLSFNSTTRVVSLSNGGGSFTLPEATADGNTFVVSSAFNTGTGVLALTRNDGQSVTVDLDGRYLQSFTEADGSTTNELQTLGFDPATRVVSLSGGGGQFTLPEAALDGNTYLTGAEFSTTTGVLSLTNSDATTFSIDLDGRYLQSFTEVDGSVTNELQTISYDAGTRTVTLSNGGGSFVLPEGSDLDSTVADGNTFIVSGAFAAASGEITLVRNDGAAILFDLDGRYLQTEVDGSITNELQTLSFNSATRTVSLSNGGGSFVIPNVSDGNTYVNQGAFNAANGELTLTRTDGATITTDLDGRYLQTEADGSTSNELQVLSYNTSTRTISLSNGGGSVVLPVAPEPDGNTFVTSADFAATTGVLTLTQNNGTTIDVNLDGRYLTTFTEVDGSLTNEIQALSYNPATRVLSLSNGGGAVALPEPVNIYNSDGTLTGPRVVNQGVHNLTFAGSGVFFVDKEYENEEGLHVSTLSMSGDEFSLFYHHDDYDADIHETRLEVEQSNNESGIRLQASSLTAFTTRLYGIEFRTRTNGSTAAANRGAWFYGDYATTNDGTYQVLMRNPADGKVYVRALSAFGSGTADGNTYTTGASFNTTNGVLTFTRNDAATYTVDLDGRFLSSEVDGSITNEVQTLSYDAGTRTVSLSLSGGSFVLPAEADGSVTNELQTLSIAGNELTLSNGGGTVQIPTGATYTAQQGLTLNGSALEWGGTLYKQMYVDAAQNNVSIDNASFFHVTSVNNPVKTNSEEGNIYMSEDYAHLQVLSNLGEASMRTDQLTASNPYVEVKAEDALNVGQRITVAKDNITFEQRDFDEGGTQTTPLAMYLKGLPAATSGELQVVIDATSGQLRLGAVAGSGGTELPAQTGHDGKALTTNGTTATWTPMRTEALKIYQDLGLTTIKAETLWGLETCGQTMNMTDGTLHLSAIYLPERTAISGVTVNVVTAGVYTGDGFNGAALYSYDATTQTYTQVAISANNELYWKTAGFQNIAFTSEVTLGPGAYFIGLQYNSSAQTTAPALLRATNTMRSGAPGFQFPGNVFLSASRTSNATPLASYTTGWGQSVNPVWQALYHQPVAP